MPKTWKIAPSCPSDFERTLGLESPLVAQLLWNRGLRTADEARGFLEPSWENGVHDPQIFSGMTAAVKRVFEALQNGERITIHGDYDADGVTGSTVLITTLRELERRIKNEELRIKDPNLNSQFSIHDSSVDFYIPHRDKEGYGLRRETVVALKERGTKLVITVDCGIANVDEIAFARTEGLDVIVVDHHRFGDSLPDGHLIHPGLPNETYPFKHLAAVGVAYKFSCALLAEARRRNLDIPIGWEKWLLDLVAVATVTDMVPLIGENRVLEKFGLTVLNKTRRPGLKALIRAARLEGKQLSAESIGFGLGPRLNAAGRMDHANLALRLMLTESDDEADLLAAELEQHNRDRQDATGRMVAQAELMIDEGKLMESRLLALWHEEWSPSLVGLVAGRCLERASRPTIAVGCHAGIWIGSGRSSANFDITEALRVAGEGLLVRLGGHSQACGFTVKGPEALVLLRERLAAYALERLNESDLSPTLDIDAEISLDQADLNLCRELERFEPCGQGNPRPIFSSRATVISSDAIGATGNTLRLTLRKPNGGWLKAVFFKQGALAQEIRPGANVDLAFQLTINEWRGTSNAEAHVVDVRPVVPL